MAGGDAAPEQVSFIVAMSTSVSVLFGMAMPGYRSSDASLRFNSPEQIFACLIEMDSRMHDIQAVVPLPKGLWVQGEEVISPSLTRVTSGCSFTPILASLSSAGVQLVVAGQGSAAGQAFLACCAGCWE